MIAFLRLIRFPNLLIIALTQVLMRFFIITPLLMQIREDLIWNYNAQLPLFTPQFRLTEFALLVLSTILITAAGYVINDYFDAKTDVINRPLTVVVGKSISRRMAMTIHTILNVSGVILGFYLAWKIGHPWIGVVFFLVAGLLWFYSTTYKRQFLVGNILVAFLTALVPFMVVLFEIPMLNRVYGQLMVAYQANFYVLIYWVGGFSVFAFITTLLREIIKDIEDFEGDRAFGRNTLPVVIGVEWTRWITLILTLLTIAAVMLTCFLYLSDRITMVYVSALLILPLAALMVFIARAKTQKQFHLCSLLVKGIMLAGVCYALVANYLLTNNLQ